MKPQQPTLRAAILAGLVTLASSCAVTPTGKTIEGRVGPVEFAVFERPVDKPAGAPDFSLRHGGFVDRNSLLVVDFGGNDAGRPRATANDATWDAIKGWIDRLATFTDRAAELAKDIEEARSAGTLATLIGAVDKFNDDEVLPLQEDAAALLLKLEPEVAAAQAAMDADPDNWDGWDDWDGLEPLTAFLTRRGAEQDLAGYSEYFAERLAGERSALRSTLDNAGQVRVLVSAFADSSDSDAVRLHVRNYDSIQSASPSAQKNLGFNLSPSERERVKRDLEQADAAKAVLEDIDERLDEIIDRSSNLADELEQAVVSLGRSLRESLSGIPEEDPDGNVFTTVELSMQNLAEVLKDAEGTVSGNTETARAALQDFAEKSAAAATSVQDLVDAGEAIFDLNFRREFVSILQGEDSELVATAEAVLDLAEVAGDAVGAAIDASRDLPATLDGIQRDEVLADSLALVPDEIRQSIDGWLNEVEPWIELATKAGAVLQITDGDLAAAAKAVDAGDGVSLPRTLNDLRDGMVELGDNVQTGDRVRLLVQTIDEDDVELERQSFDFRVTWMGWRRDVRGEAILVRGDSGPDTAQRWKPNVAAMASWHYRYRQPEGSWGAFVNWLDPGIGVHAASVDLDVDESTEFGLGVQVRFWDGLLFAGVGQDLNVDDDRTYYFVGTSLLKLLGSLSD